MEFQVASFRLPAHFVFESLGYLLGFRLYLSLRTRWGDEVSQETRWSVIAAAAVGAAIGSKLLGWLDHPVESWAHRVDPIWLLGGKTIVGGLIGGWIGVELAKRALGEVRSTGDLFVLPLCVGISIGRVGCFLGGLPDHTYGIATSLPWGVDFGDGIRRHPVQLYEIVALSVIAVWAIRSRQRVMSGALRPGDLFRGFMVGYAAFRVAIDVIKPESRDYLGLSGIQLASIFVLLYYVRDLPRLALGSRNV
jgi:prolipoprotein diacylglyceryltransferase